MEIRFIPNQLWRCSTGTRSDVRYLFSFHCRTIVCGFAITVRPGPGGFRWNWLAGCGLTCIGGLLCEISINPESAAPGKSCRWWRGWKLAGSHLHSSPAMSAGPRIYPGAMIHWNPRSGSSIHPRPGCNVYPAMLVIPPGFWAAFHFPG